MALRRIRVLCVITVPMERNGITGVVMNLLSHSDPEVVQFDVAAWNDPPEVLKRQLDALGARLYRLPQRLRWPLSYSRRLDALLREGRYDILHVHGNSATMAIELWTARRAGVEVRIAHAHNTFCKYKCLHTLLYRRFLRELTQGMACSHSAGAFLFDSHTPYVVINNGVSLKHYQFDAEARAEARRTLGIAPEALVLGHVGALLPVKNQAFLLELLAQLQGRRSGVVALLVGEGPDRTALLQRAGQLGIASSVLLTGRREDVPALMAAMDLFVMPSLFEGLPLTLVEAQASGLSCLASEAITREADLTGNVRFLSLNAPGEWVEAIAAFAPQGREVRAARAQQALRAAHYDIEETAEQLTARYREYLGWTQGHRGEA